MVPQVVHEALMSHPLAVNERCRPGIDRMAKAKNCPMLPEGGLFRAIRWAEGQPLA